MVEVGVMVGTAQLMAVKSNKRDRFFTLLPLSDLKVAPLTPAVLMWF